MMPETDHPEETKLEGDQLPAEPGVTPPHNGADDDQAREAENPPTAAEGGGEGEPPAARDGGDEGGDEEGGGEEPSAPEPGPPAEPDNKHWYVVKVASGREESIKDAIERRVKIE